MADIRFLPYAAQETNGGALGHFCIWIVCLAAAIIGITFCKANKDGTKKDFLRFPGVETVVGIAITAGFGFGIPRTIAGVAQFFL